MTRWYGDMIIVAESFRGCQQEQPRDLPLNLSSHTVHLNGPAFLKKLAPHPIHPYDQGHWGAFSIKPSSTFLFFRAGQETPKIVVSNEFFRETSTHSAIGHKERPVTQQPSHPPSSTYRYQQNRPWLLCRQVVLCISILQQPTGFITLSPYTTYVCTTICADPNFLRHFCLFIVAAALKFIYKVVDGSGN